MIICVACGDEKEFRSLKQLSSKGYVCPRELREADVHKLREICQVGVQLVRDHNLKEQCGVPGTMML